jgi:hypothetical protein
MDIDKEKIDEYTLALLYLVVHERQEGTGARAWKGFDWETLNRLHEKGYIANPVGKAKSVGMSEEGFLKAKELFERLFIRKASVKTLPHFSGDAMKRWNQIVSTDKQELLENVWCGQCRAVAVMQLENGKMLGRSLLLSGICKKCGGEVARVIEPVE